MTHCRAYVLTVNDSEVTKVEPKHSISLCGHGNPNAVTIDKGTSNLAQGPSALSCLVELERLSESAPDVRAFSAPVTHDVESDEVSLLKET